MTTTIEISMYPLTSDYPSHVLRFLGQLKQITDVEISTNGMSTILIGNYSSIWSQLGRLMEEEMAKGYSLFVMKVAPGRREFINED